MMGGRVPRLFDLDSASVRAYHVGLGLLVLWITLERWTVLRVFYSDDGTLPTTRLRELTGGGLRGGSWGAFLHSLLCVHGYSGGLLWQRALCLLQVALAAMLALGRRRGGVAVSLRERDAAQYPAGLHPGPLRPHLAPRGGLLALQAAPLSAITAAVVVISPHSYSYSYSYNHRAQRWLLPLSPGGGMDLLGRGACEAAGRGRRLVLGRGEPRRNPGAGLVPAPHPDGRLPPRAPPRAAGAEFPVRLRLYPTP